MKNEVSTWIETQRKVDEPAPLNKHWSVEEKESILDYLHSDVADDEVKACCYYEYARASETLRRARQQYDPADPEKSSPVVFGHFPPWVRNADRVCFLHCEKFPQSAWRDLPKAERANFRSFFKAISLWPIITDVRMLKALRVFDQFNQQAKNEDADDKIFDGLAQAAVGDGPIRHVVVTIDYRDGVQAKKEQLGDWLANEANRKLFDTYYKQPKQDPESANYYRQLLKFLASWRVYDELDFKEAKEWTRHNRRRETERLKLRAFFGERPSKVFEKDRQFFGPLYSERRDWEEAIDKAKDFLVREIELRPSADVG